MRDCFIEKYDDHISFFRSSQKINYSTWIKYLEILADSKTVDIQSLKSKLSNCGLPATNKATVNKQSLQRVIG